MHEVFLNVMNVKVWRVDKRLNKVELPLPNKEWKKSGKDSVHVVQ